mgnify:CR=1 FL=1
MSSQGLHRHTHANTDEAYRKKKLNKINSNNNFKQKEKIIVFDACERKQASFERK